MKAWEAAAALLLATLLASCATVGRGWGPDGRYQALFDDQFIETISGEVVLIERIFPLRGMSWGEEITVRTADDRVPVHLGPVWYLKRQLIRIREGDFVVVRGSRILYEGGVAYMAVEVSVGGLTLKLRDDDGLPRWSGWTRQ